MRKHEAGPKEAEEQVRSGETAFREFFMLRCRAPFD
jgi:hypothetical protein